ncbi:MAG TPA: bifunctional phosphopantothenoylcysteine decarboxylase/phosphopantothenate--cysteine ligase CoaBC [Cytophagaceae bacterium]
MLQGKKILLGVCGSIAAYKSAVLIRLLIKEGAEVRVIMTSSAFAFISPLTLSTLSKNPVLSEFTKGDSGEWNNHVEAGLWADLMLVAPASANSIAKFASGICDNFLTATYLSARCPVFIAPAMDLDMYAHPTTQNNLKKLQSYGNAIIDSEYGELASGLTGTGRMAEPESILKKVKEFFNGQGSLKGHKVMVTAGPTYEALDPVRFISNHSTGKMGYEIAECLASAGAEVFLVSGPTSITVKHPSIHLIKVKSAADMYKAASEYFDQSSIAILAAAVADYTPKVVADKKIKKNDAEFSIELVKTVDIARELGKRKKEGQILVGFALETDNELENARKKLESKNLDFIVLNSLKDPGAGFAVDTNKITIIEKNNKIREFELKSKKEVASDIVKVIENYVHG